jgi:UDP-N-acetylglucosamine transferase subunit ALG13
MIFVTVGTELPFDRLVRPIDEWARRHNRTDVFAQIGPSSWRPQHVKWAHFLDASECRERMASAQLVISHAGMGTIVKARELGKPILVMPRRAELNEHRSNHQLDAMKQLSTQGNVVTVMDEKELLEELDNLDKMQTFPSVDRISQHAPRQLLDLISNFIDLGALPVGSDTSRADLQAHNIRQIEPAGMPRIQP